MKKKYLAFLIPLLLAIQPAMGTEPLKGCSGLFFNLPITSEVAPQVSTKLAAEIRDAYSKYLKEVSPTEEDTIISLIAAAEKKFSRAKVQAELKTALTECRLGSK